MTLLTPFSMKPLLSFPLFFALLLCSESLALRAGDAPPPLPPLAPALVALAPVKIIETTAEPKLISNLGGDQFATIAPGAAHTSGHPVFRLNNPATNSNHFAVEALWRTSTEVKKGSSLLARFYVRTIFAKQEAGEATFSFYFQQVSTPWTKSILTRISVGKDWQLIELPFKAADDYAPGKVAAFLSFAYFPQTVEFTTPVVLDFGTRIGVNNLPKTQFPYAGREPNAAWRTAALARIETLRTAPLNITVTDAAGKPVAGAQVSARMNRAEFIFGSEVEAAWILKKTADAERYRKMALSHFDALVPGNALKWQFWYYETAADADYGYRDQTKKALDWLFKQDTRVKGHTFVWGAWEYTPREVRDMPDKAERDRVLPKLIDESIRDRAAATKGHIAIWDVLNEPVNQSSYIDILGEQAAANWFKLAREVAPNSQLFINEFNILTGGDSRIFAEKYLALIKRLRALGAPMDGIGIQGHFGQTMPGMEVMLADMDLMASAGLPLQITEFDVNTEDEQLQADFTRDFLIACYSHPAFTGFFNWGFWEGSHWVPRAALYRKDWTPKPNGKVWEELVLGQWRTKFSQKSDAAGLVAARGHRGRYEVVVTANGKTTTQVVELTGKGTDVTVKLP